MNKLLVSAVKTAMLPREGATGFVGWRRAAAGEAPDHVAPGGFGWVLLKEPVEVLNSPYHRKALRRGELTLAQASEPVPDKGSKKGV